MSHLLPLLLLSFVCAACEPSTAPESEDADEIAVLQMRGGGEIWIRFLAELAPRHVENFKTLARDGFYDGTTFHRVIPGFMIQGGDLLSKDDDPSNDGRGTPGYFVEAEFSDTRHRRGIVSMARRGSPDTAGSQFFIMVDSNPQYEKVLDGKYTVFGEVIQGMDVVDRIVATRRDHRDRPVVDQVMEAVRMRPAPEPETTEDEMTEAPTTEE